MGELEAATTDQLVDELARRYPKGLVVAGLKPAPDGDDEVPVIIFRHGLTVALGLATRAADLIRVEARAGMICDELEDDDEEEDQG